MSAPLRITFVSRKWPPAMGGMETYARALSDALCDHGEVEVIALPGNPDGSPPSALALVRFGIAAGARLVFARHPAPVVHVADMASWPLALAARLRRPSGRRVLSAHGTDVTFPRRGGVLGWLYGLYLRCGALLTKPVTVIANSGATAAETRRYGFADVHVVPLAADTGPVPAPDGGPSRALLFSGRLIPLKGASWFVREVLPLLPEDITLDVAGTAWDAEERAALDVPRVRYLGRVDQQRLWAAHAGALAVVIPNVPVPTGQFEGFGLVAVEAASAGGVVLAARHGGLADAVIDGETGFLLEPGDASGWAAKIIEIAGWTAGDRAGFVGRAQARVAEHFTWDRVARETAALYTGSRHDR